MSNPNVPVQQQAIDELNSQVYGPNTEEDQVALNEWQHELDNTRQKHFQELGATPVGDLVEINGALEQKDHVAALRADGQEVVPAQHSGAHTSN